MIMTTTPRGAPAAPCVPATPDRPGFIFDPRHLPEPRPVALDQISAKPKEMSPRRGEPNEAHVRALAKHLADGVSLDPLFVVPRARSFLVVDGHHRLAAYKLARWAAPVPVRVFEADTLTTLRLAVQENAKDRLPLTSSERTDWAWKIVRAEQEAKHANSIGQRADKSLVKLSKAKIAEFTGTSRRLVADMRAVWQAWFEQDVDVSIEALGQPWQITGDWLRDRKSARGENEAGWSAEQKAAWREQRRDPLAREVRSLASVAPNDHQLVAEALAQVLGRYTPIVAAALAEVATKTNG